MPIQGPVLALDSSTTTGSVAVGDGRGGLLAEVVLNVAGVHSASLLPAAEQAVRSAGLTPSDVRAVVVGAGPGSFTGLRIAAATAKGVIAALGVPLLAYPSLLAAAASAWPWRGAVCALFDARRRDVYAACYHFEQGLRVTGDRLQEEPDPVTCNLSPVTCLSPPEALTVDELIERHRGAEAPLFVGDGAVRHADELARELGAAVMPAGLGLPRASQLLWLAHRVPELGHVADVAAWEPDYVRAAGVERIAADRAAGGGAA